MKSSRPDQWFQYICMKNMPNNPVEEKLRKSSRGKYKSRKGIKLLNKEFNTPSSSSSALSSLSRTKAHSDILNTKWALQLFLTWLQNSKGLLNILHIGCLLSSGFLLCLMKTSSRNFTDVYWHTWGMSQCKGHAEMKKLSRQKTPGFSPIRP